MSQQSNKPKYFWVIFTIWQSKLNVYKCNKDTEMNISQSHLLLCISNMKIFPWQSPAMNLSPVESNATCRNLTFLDPSGSELATLCTMVRSSLHENNTNTTIRTGGNALSKTTPTWSTPCQNLQHLIFPSP